MKLTKYFFAGLVGAALLAALSSPSFAQVNTVTQTGVTTEFNNKKQTYSAAFIGLVPAASATDTVCIIGSATKTVAITHIGLSGTAGTLVTLPVTLLVRTSADTGGTAASTTANPANTIRPMDTANAAATAVPISYTAVPTIVDTSPLYVRSTALTLPVTTAGTSVNPIRWEFPTNLALGTQALVLRGVAQQACINLNTISVSSGVLTGSLEWIEY